MTIPWIDVFTHNRSPVLCAVPSCGLKPTDKKTHEGEEALQQARKELIDGKIIAVKGLGGYLLACDASNLKAVTELRKRKNRSQKPFALMAWNLESIRKYCRVSDEEADLLSSHQSPIVLLEKTDSSSLPDEIAPHQRTLGFMLPYTPLHKLLMEPETGFPEILVMTSGNQSEEPIAYTDEDARIHLSGLADGFLMHDRPIEMRTDDSVTRVIDQQPYLIRRARGYAPLPVRTTSQCCTHAGDWRANEKRILPGTGPVCLHEPSYRGNGKPGNAGIL